MTAGCPDDNLFAQLVDGTLDEDTYRTTELHLDACARCTEFVAELAYVLAPPPPAPPGYRLLRRIDDISWHAETEAGDAKVAVSFGAAVAPELVTVRDPHVMRVDQVGERDGQPFVVHEVATRTEAQWRAARVRSAAEIIAVWRQALTGLVALHRAGITFALSPEHVLVEPDGRVLVGNFARDLSRTSGYLAPEVLAGAAPSQRSDQFAACAAMWEALAGTRPFSGATVGALAVSTSRPPELPDEGDRRRFAVLARGMSAQPARRFAGIEELIATLDRKPGDRRIWIAAIAIALLLIAFVLVRG